MNKVGRIGFYLLILIGVITTKCKNDSLKTEILEKQVFKNKIKITKISFDTIKLKLPYVRISEPSTYKITNSIYKNGLEVLSISNFNENKIHLIDFKNREYIKSIQLIKEGPNATISGSYGFYHYFIGNDILVMDPFTRNISIINEAGEVIRKDKIPEDDNFYYVTPIDYSIQGDNIGGTFFYPAFPSGYNPEVGDSQLAKVKSFIRYDIKTGFKPMFINRRNYYTNDEFYNYESCCWSYFISSLDEDYFLTSDCVSPIIKKYYKNNEITYDSIKMKSMYLEQVPKYKSLSPSEWKNMSTELMKDILKFSHKAPSYRQIYVDKESRIIIRQVKLELSEEEFLDNPTEWSNSFILIDLDTYDYLGEFKIERKDKPQIEFFDGIMTSHGLCFKIKSQTNQDEDTIYLLRLKFE